jgi:hypothetical protein
MVINNKYFPGSFNDINSKSKSKDEFDYLKLPWSISKIEEELVFHLSSYNDTEINVDKDNSRNNNNEIIVKHPYQEQANELLYKINLANTILVFKIYDKTLPPKLKEELNDLWKRDKELFDEIVTNSLKRLYESIDHRYFHTSGVKGKISWAIVQ